MALLGHSEKQEEYWLCSHYQDIVDLTEEHLKEQMQVIKQRIYNGLLGLQKNPFTFSFIFSCRIFFQGKQLGKIQVEALASKWNCG